MKVLILLALVGAACAATLPLEAPAPVTDTEEVVQVRAAAPAPVADTEEVVQARAVAPAPVADTEEVVQARAAAPALVTDTEDVVQARAAAPAPIADTAVVMQARDKAPAPVMDTEKERQATAAFERAYAAAAAAAIEIPKATYLDYTKEVAAARADFQTAYDSAAARAEAAADTDLDGRLSTYSGLLSTRDGRLSPLYTNTFGAYGIHAPMPARSPVFTGANVIAGTPLAAGSPLTYSGLGFPGAFGPHRFYSPYGFPM